MNILTQFGEKLLLEQLQKLPPDAKRKILAQANTIDMPSLQRQEAVLREAQYVQRDVTPYRSYSNAGNAIHAKQGREAIAKGEVGCLILAGGQGTRLGFAGPKGMYPISPVHKKTLFQIFAEKTAAAGRNLPIAIMTSPLNHNETVQFFTSHNFFGLSSDQVSFFPQSMLPFLDEEGRLFLSSPESLAEGPDGNGNAFHNLVRSGIEKRWSQQGVKYVNVVLVDNPLADPFDAELVGFTIAQQSDITIKGTLRTDEKENVGVVSIENGKIVVVEYSEMPPEDYASRDANGVLNYHCANLSLFCLKMDFIRTLTHKAELPLHKAFKATPFLNAKGEIEQRKAWKFERFIFDILPYSSKTSVLIYPRETCFSPLKKESGPDSPETVQQALQARDRQILRHLGLPVPDGPIELPQEYHYR